MDSNMEYRYLGDTGIRVSCIGYGCMDFNDQSVLDDLLPRVYKHGINFLDCAEIYGGGVVETLLGNSLKKLEADREDLVITTKFILGGQTCNRIGLSYKHLNEGMAASLKRMQLDYVDVAFAHRDDPGTSMEEICRGFNALIEDGHAFYWATSEWTADRIMEAFAVCERLGLIRPIADQCEYNLLRRDKMEKDYLNLFDNYRYGTTIWSPLAGGLLTGKYNEEIPGESRLTQNSRFSAYFKTYFKDGNVDNARPMLREIEKISKDAGLPMSQLALAWCVKNKDVSTAIIGSKKPAQLDENIKALEVIKNITPEIEERLDKVLNNRPVPGFNWKTNAPNKSRREISAL